MTQIKNDPRVYRKNADPKRAINQKGQLIADDPSTPDVNAPKKKAANRGKKSPSKS